jgi:hypothetical protein
LHRRLFPFALSLALAACGDDGSGSSSGGGGGGSQNLPPAFTSAQSVTVPENTAGPVYQATATDPENQPLTFTISGGADAARLTMSPTGALSFVSPPDFERPTDSDGNNTYLVTISVSDGVNTTTLNLTVTVTDVPGDNFLVRQFTGVDPNPLQLATIPGDRRVAIVTPTRIFLADTATGANEILMSSEVPADKTLGCGLNIHGIAFSPNFATDRTFYVLGDCELRYLEIRRFRFPDPGGAVVGHGERILKADTNPFGSTSNDTRADDMRFGPDGLLYIATGDRSSNFTSPVTFGFARDLSSLSGKLLRIDVSADGFPADPDRNYRIPAGNPFSGGGGAPEIYAYGFHIPKGLEFNGADVLFADRGYDANVAQAPNPVHEIDLVRPTDAGGDYGFYNCQGDRDFSGSGPCTFPTILPVIQATSPVNVDGRYLIGGIIYDGAIQDLRGQYLFAYAGNGRTPTFWSVPVAQLQQGANLKLATLRDRTADLHPVSGSLGGLAAMGKDLQGNVYLLDTDGEVFVIVPAP